MLAPLCLFMLFVAGDAWSVSHSRADQVGNIEPPTETDWGDWGTAEYCNPGSYAYGFKMNVGNRKPPKDDTGVNGIVLFCKPVAKKDNDKIASTYKMWGVWQSKLSCPGQTNYFTGVKIKSQPKQGPGLGLGLRADDTAANNFEFICQDGTNLTGVGGSKGHWGKQVSCPPNSAICGIKTKVENWKRKRFWKIMRPDNTALNKAIFYCCSTA